MAKNKEERAQEWMELAHTFARYPKSAPSRTGTLVFGLVSLMCFFLGGFGIFAAYTPAVSVAEFYKVLGPSITLVGLGAIMMVFTVLSKRSAEHRAARRTSFVAQAEARRGQILDGLQLAGWLIQHWDDDYPQEGLLASPEVYRAAIPVGGFSVLVDYTPDGYHMTGNSQHNRWWARLVVPAGPYVDLKMNPDHPEVSRIRDMGYAISLGPGGLVARGLPTFQAAIREHPEGIFEVASQLVELAQMIDTSAPETPVPLTLHQDMAAQNEPTPAGKLPVVFLVLLVVITVLSWVASMSF